jgi:hypothetical protein
MLLPVKKEYTSANTPQPNALVEVKFTYLAAKARAAMYAAEVPKEVGIFPRGDYDYDQTRLVKADHNQQGEKDQD